MSRYKMTINTDAYKCGRCSKKNWEAGTRNDYMIAIKLIELFMKRYEEYRSVQLQRVYTKMGQTMEETMAIKKCN